MFRIWDLRWMQAYYDQAEKIVSIPLALITALGTVIMKVVRIIQGYVNVVNKMVWRKDQ